MRSDENVARFEQTASNSNSDIVGTCNMLQKYYYRPQELAEKNQVHKEDKFEAIALLLSNAGRMIDGNNCEGAGRNLERVYAILEEIRADLYDERDEEEKLASEKNSTSQADEEGARKLTETAARYEKKALELLNQTGSDAEAKAEVQEALSLIANVRASIEAQDLDSARNNLGAALSAINDAKRLIEDEDDNDANISAPNSGENSDSSGSGSGKGNGNEGNNGPDKGSNDEDDQ